MIVMSSFLRPVRAVASATAVAALVTACGPVDGGETGDRPRVVTSFYPLQYVAERVAGDHVEVINLTDPGAEPHDLELTVAQTVDVAEADLAFYQAGFQPAVDDAVAQSDPDRVVDVTEVVSLTEGGDHAEESPEEHAEHGAADPHFWLDPELMAEVAAAFTDAVTEVDPEHADDYESGLAALRTDLRDLDAAYAEGLADCKRDTVVVSHDAFGYLEKYGLHFEAIAGLSPDVEPSPAHVAELQNLIEAEGVTTVFAETLASPAYAETLAADLDIETSVLDPIEGLGSQDSTEDYLSLMRANLDALRTANGCR
jgi:zinc transport system substrate-binding protein